MANRKHYVLHQSLRRREDVPYVVDHIKAICDAFDRKLFQCIDTKMKTEKDTYQVLAIRPYIDIKTQTRLFFSFKHDMLVLQFPSYELLYLHPAFVIFDGYKTTLDHVGILGYQQTDITDYLDILTTERFFTYKPSHDYIIYYRECVGDCRDYIDDDHTNMILMCAWCRERYANGQKCNSYIYKTIKPFIEQSEYNNEHLGYPLAYPFFSDKYKKFSGNTTGIFEERNIAEKNIGIRRIDEIWKTTTTYTKRIYM